jgi:outer membrane protein assembly factor BamB
VVAFFGSEGLYAYDLEGTLLWEKDLGRLHSGFYVVPQAQWGFGSSPVIHAGLVLVQCDVQEGSFIAAFGAADGREVWRTRRDEVPTWSTPAIYLCDTNEDRSAQVIANGYRHIGGYDLHTGKALWRLRGGGDIPVPTPVVWEDLVFITNAHGSLAPIYAVRAAGAQGEIELGDGDWSHTHLAWSEKRGGNYMQTPIVYRDWLYLCKDNGVVSCYEPRTGKLVFRERLGTGKSGFTASPVAADGKLYFTSEDGDVYVLAAGVDKLEVRATNKLGEVAMATPAISRGELFFRTRRHVVCIVEPAKESAEAAEPRRD